MHGVGHVACLRMPGFRVVPTVWVSSFASDAIGYLGMMEIVFVLQVPEKLRLLRID